MLMRRSAILLLSLTMFGNVQALQLKSVQAAPNVYAFIGDLGARTYENEAMNANAGFIVTTAGVVVVDSGSSYQVAKAMHTAIRQVTPLPVKYVINTSGQDHRWLGNGYFKEQGAVIVSSRRARADMEERAAGQIEALKPVLRERLAKTQSVYPTRLFDREERLTFGGENIRIFYFHGGHTPGDSVVWLPKTGVLFSSDIVYVDRLLMVLPISNTKDWIASFAEIEKLDPKVIVPGHGRVCDLGQARRETRDYLVLLRTHARKAVDDLVDMQSAVETLDQSAFRYLENYEALKGINANRVYLEVEKE